MIKNIKKIVCIGGGSGVSMVLSSLIDYSYNLTAIVTMFDNGGSSGKLRKELGILPLGDVRACLSVLSKEKTIIPLFYYRFQRGKLKGHNLGNLILAATEQLTGSLEKGIEKIGSILKVKGKVLPVALESAHIKVVLNNGNKIVGEEEIINCRDVSRVGIRKISLEPKVKVNPSAIRAIKEADLIIIAPGKFYTSIIPNLLVEGISEAITKSSALKFLITNLMTQVGNTDNLKVNDFLRIIENYLSKGNIDRIIFNTSNLSPTLMKKVREVFPRAGVVNYDKRLLKDKKFIGGNFIDKNIYKSNPSDILVKGQNKRTMILHNSKKLGEVINKILCKL